MDFLAVRNIYGPIANKLIFGDGSDGAVTHSSLTTLTRDLFCTTYTCSGVVTTDGFKIFAQQSITVTSIGSIINNGVPGNNGSGTTGGSGGTAAGRGSCDLVPLSGGNGGSVLSVSGGSGNNGGATSGDFKVGQSGNGGNGGQGKDSICVANVGVPGVGGTAGTDIYWPQRSMLPLHRWFGSLAYPYTGMRAGSGGGGSGRLIFGRPTGGGGGGSGAPGGCVLLCAPLIDVQASGNVKSFGGAGGAGANGRASSNAGGGGGGGGGNGGTIHLIYEKLIESGTVVTDGGAGGAGGSGDNCGANGGTSNNPLDQAGRTFKHDLNKLTIVAS